MLVTSLTLEENHRPSKLVLGKYVTSNASIVANLPSNVVNFCCLCILG